MCLLSIHNCGPHGLFPNTCLRNRSLLRDEWEGEEEGRMAAWRDRVDTVEGARVRKYETSPGPVRDGNALLRSASRAFLPALSEFASSRGVPSPGRRDTPLRSSWTRIASHDDDDRPKRGTRRRTLEGTRTRETPRTERAREARTYRRASRTLLEAVCCVSRGRGSR